MAKVEGRENFGEDPKFIGKEVEKTLHGRKHCLLLADRIPKRSCKMFEQ